jgi:methyl-accepting chemotaxis protein
MKRILPQTVKARLMSLIGFSFCLMISISVILTAIERKKTFILAEKLRLEAKFNGVQNAFEDEARSATAMALVVAAMPDVQKAFGSRNREQLMALTLPFFKNEKERLSLAQFQFHLPPATSFLRLHKPEKFGDDLSSIRQTVLAVNKNRQPISGIEKGRAGLGIRGVVPVSMNGNHMSEGMQAGASAAADRTNTVATAAEEMSVNMNSVAAASEQASTNVNMVAEKLGEMVSRFKV